MSHAFKFSNKQLNHNKNINFQLGMYFRQHGEYTKSERFLRYSANAGNIKARHELNNGIKNAIYLNPSQRINLTAIELLEQLVSQTPHEDDIDYLEQAIATALSHIREKNLGQQSV